MFSFTNFEISNAKMLHCFSPAPFDGIFLLRANKGRTTPHLWNIVWTVLLLFLLLLFQFLFSQCSPKRYSNNRDDKGAYFWTWSEFILTLTEYLRLKSVWVGPKTYLWYASTHILQTLLPYYHGSWLFYNLQIKILQPSLNSANDITTFQAGGLGWHKTMDCKIIFYLHICC